MKTLFSSLAKMLKQAWSLDTRSLSLFRVGLAIVVIVDLCLRSRFFIEHYTDLGLFPRDAFLAVADGKNVISFHTVNGQAWYQTLLFLVHGFFALCMLFGYRTRIATIIVWVFTVSLQNRLMIINSGADDLLRMALFWGMFLPLDRHWAWESDRYEADLHPNLKQVFGVATVAFIVQQIALYWVTAYLKLGSEWYVDHSAVYQILSLESFRTLWGNWLYQHLDLMKMITWLSMLIEVFAPIFLIVPILNSWGRFAGITLIIGLHLGIVTNIGVGFFPWISMISMLAFLPATFWDVCIKKLAPKGKMTIYFDDQCTLCRRWVRLLRSYCFLWGVDYTGLSQAPESIQKISEKNDSWVTTRGRKDFIRYGAFIELMRQSWLFRPFAWFGNIPPLNLIGERIYSYGNHLRQYCDIYHPIVPYPTHSLKKNIAKIVCAISLYVVIIINISVISCGGTWQGFFQKFPLSLSAILHERGFYLVENDHVNYGHGGWSGPGYTAPRSSEVCTNTETLGHTLPAWIQSVIQLHGNIIWWWTFVPRLDQYWGMFAPHPLQNNYWLVIDADLRDTVSQTPIKKDLWKSYAIGANDVSFEKPNNLHELSISDRWRKYTNNIIEGRFDEKYVDSFARFWCKRYNNAPASTEQLERFTIYGMWQTTESDYVRGKVQKKTLWQHCCLENGCFNPKN